MGIKQTAIRAVNAAIATVTTNPWAGKAWGLDVARYSETINIPKGIIDFGIAKLGGSDQGVYLDPKFAQHVQAIYDAGGVPMAYWYVDSSWYREFTIDGVRAQSNDNHPILQTIIRGLRAGNGWKVVRGLFLDLEAHGKGSAWNHAYCEDLRNRFADLRKTGGFPDIPLGIYSRQGFMATQPEMSSWCEQRPEVIIWTANYTTSFPGLAANLATIKANRLPMTTQKPLWFGDNPAKPKQYRRIWQYHGTAPGCQYVTCPEVGPNSGLDLNVYEGTQAELRAEFGMPVVPPVPEPIPTPVPTPTPANGEYREQLNRIEKTLGEVRGKFS